MSSLALKASLKRCEKPNLTLSLEFPFAFSPKYNFEIKFTLEFILSSTKNSRGCPTPKCGIP